MCSRRHVEAVDVDGVEGRDSADRRVDGGRLVGDAVEDPLEHAGVLAVAGPEELAVGVLAEPVDVEDLGQGVAVGSFRADAEPVREVVGHVVTAERQHGEGVAAQVADRAGLGRRGLRGHDRAEEDAVLPVVGLEHQRDDRGAAAAEEDGADRHALGVLPLGGDGGVLAAGAVKRALGWAAGVPFAGVQSSPFQSVRCAGGSSVMPSHQMSPSSVSAVLVKMQLPSRVKMALGLVWVLVPGATPKNPASGLMA